MSWTGGEVGEPGQETGANSHPFLWKPADYRLPGLPACLAELSTGPLGCTCGTGRIGGSVPGCQGSLWPANLLVALCLPGSPSQGDPHQEQTTGKSSALARSRGVATPPQLDDMEPGMVRGPWRRERARSNGRVMRVWDTFQQSSRARQRRQSKHSADSSIHELPLVHAQKSGWCSGLRHHSCLDITGAQGPTDSKRQVGSMRNREGCRLSGGQVGGCFTSAIGFVLRSHCPNRISRHLDPFNMQAAARCATTPDRRQTDSTCSTDAGLAI